MAATVSGRERILREARAFFFERGYAEVSMQQIADAAGVTKAALYYHFRDKDDLFVQVVVGEMESQRQLIEAQIARGGSFASLLERVARLYFDQLDAVALRMMVEFRKNVSESRHADVHQELDRFVTSLATLFERAAGSGEIRDIPPRLGAFLFFNTLMAFVMQPGQDPLIVAPPDPQSAAQMAASIVLHGIAAPGKGNSGGDSTTAE